MVNTEEVNTEEVNAEEEAKTEKKLTKAVQLYDDEKLLEAGRILENIDDRTSFERKHLTIVEKAHKAQALVDELKTDLDTNDKSSEWIIHGVSKGEFPTLTAHKLQKTSDGTHIELKARCETPIDKSLLSPIISVLNETELYETWLPSWTGKCSLYSNNIVNMWLYSYTKIISAKIQSKEMPKDLSERKVFTSNHHYL